jgi:hypothetical protein
LFIWDKNHMTPHSKTKTSFYRRIYVTWLIEQEINTVPKIIAATAMPRRTAQDTLAAIHELAISLENNHGAFKVVSWGAINRAWVYENIAELKVVLEYP